MPRHADHAAHDRTLVAAAAANDLEGAALAEATERLASCPDCAALHADLLAIASALGELPAPVRTRDFTITAEQAAALRPTGWRRLVVGLRSPRGAIVRPLAVTFTTLGIVGLLLAAVPAAVPLGMLAGAGDFRATAGDRNEGAGVPGAEVDPGTGGLSGPELSPGDVSSPGDDGETAGGGDAGSQSTSGGADPPGGRDAATVDAGPSPWLLVLSIALLSIGIGLFAARRLTRDP
jgi:hypothetical protein